MSKANSYLVKKHRTLGSKGNSDDPTSKMGPTNSAFPIRTAGSHGRADFIGLITSAASSPEDRKACRSSLLSVVLSDPDAAKPKPRTIRPRPHRRSARRFGLGRAGQKGNQLLRRPRHRHSRISHRHRPRRLRPLRRSTHSSPSSTLGARNARLDKTDDAQKNIKAKNRLVNLRS